MEAAPEVVVAVVPEVVTVESTVPVDVPAPVVAEVAPVVPAEVPVEQAQFGCGGASAGQFGCGPCTGHFGAATKKKRLSPAKSFGHRYREHSPMLSPKKHTKKRRTTRRGRKTTRRGRGRSPSPSPSPVRRGRKTTKRGGRKTSRRVQLAWYGDI
jgi:hypothetical protein